MFEILYYRNRRGESLVGDYIRSLGEKKDKDSRIKLNKMREYINYLGIAGKQAGEPYVKRLDDDIWELRPTSERILFAAWDGDKFILLHHFTKKTQKTPQREIKQARRNLADYRERSSHDEKK